MYRIIIMPQGGGVEKIRIAYTTEHRQSYFEPEQMRDWLYEQVPSIIADRLLCEICKNHYCDFYLFDGGAVL